MDKVGRFEPPPSSLLHPYHHNGGISDEDCGAQATALPSSCTGQGLHSRSPASQLSRAQIMQVALVMLLYGILYTVFSGNLTVASLAASDLTTQSRATLPLVALFVGALLVVGPASNIMKVHGRRVGFFIGGMAGAASGLVSYLALRWGSFNLFVFGGLLLGVFDGFADYLRFAAAEIVTDTFQGRAVSLALSGGALCSVLGPQLASVATSGGYVIGGDGKDEKESEDNSGTSTVDDGYGYGGGDNDDDDDGDNHRARGYERYYEYATGVCLLFCAAVTFIKPILHEPNDKVPLGNQEATATAGPEAAAEVRDPASLEQGLLHNEIGLPIVLGDKYAVDKHGCSQAAEAAAGAANAFEETIRASFSSSSISLRALVLSPEFLVAILTGITAQFAMVMIMAALPLAMVSEGGYSFERYALTIQCHLLGMFCPGFFTGALLDAAGIFVILVAGLALLSASVAVGSAGLSPSHFMGALVLLGIAWNFLSVGSTKLLIHVTSSPSLIGPTSSASSSSSSTYCALRGDDVWGGDNKNGGADDGHRSSERQWNHYHCHKHTLQAIYEFLVFAANAVGSWLAGFESHRAGWDAVLQCTIPLTALSLISVGFLRIARPQIIGLPTDVSIRNSSAKKASEISRYSHLSDRPVA